MAIVPWAKRHRNELGTLRHEMNDLFEDFFGGLERPWSLFEAKAWPALDVAEKEDAIVVRAEVPGCKPEDIDISVYGNTLTISGEKKASTEERHDGFYHVESSYGTFRRDVALPTDVDEEKIEAVCKNGVLSVTLPKAAQSRAVKVKVQS
jgi:HSP20 family protein